MTGIEMNQRFLAKVKSLNRTEIPDMTTYDILNSINEAQDILIDQLLSEGALSLLQTIIDSETVLAAAFEVYASAPSGGIVVDLTDLTSYRNYIRSESSITKTMVPLIESAKSVANIEIDKSFLYMFESNGTNKPIFTQPKCFVEGDYLVVIADAYTTVVSEHITYVRIPDEITLAVDCELPAHLHEKIVDIAVMKSMEVINRKDLEK
jgi:hypothetical protein